MTAKTASNLHFARSESGTIHAYTGRTTKTVCGREVGDHIVDTTPDKIWRNDDLCRLCAAKMAR